MKSHADVLKARGYKILSKLGEGSYAKVYRGQYIPHQADAQKPVIYLAVKVIETKRSGPQEFNKKFLPRELNILSQISHPHIIHIHSILEIGPNFYIFMRFAEQGDLLDFMLRNGAINENQARVWTRQIALALQYLHELNIAHRDMKCENILLTNNYNAKLADFGFARFTIDSKKMPVLSETYCGSLSYVSPDVLQGRPYNPKIADLWSFGVIIYVMLNKSMPFDDSSPKTLYEKQMKGSFKFRSKVITVVSNEVKILVKNLLEPDPMKRYRIEGVINSDWIAMDKRLIALKPLELEALSNAFKNRYTLSDHFAFLPTNQTEQRASILGAGNVVHSIKRIPVEVIKAYESDQPRQSENSKM